MLNKRYLDIPAHVRAVLTALDFSTAGASALGAIADDDWPATVRFCDSAGLSPALFLRCNEYLPHKVHSQFEERLQKNVERWNRLRQAYGEIASALEKSGIEFIVLKGFTQWPLFVADPRHRTQYDIDLLLRRPDLERAAAILERVGYEPAVAGGSQPVVDHFPTLIRKTGWVWHGDYFDPDIPFSLELHFRCWDRSTENFGPAGLEDLFWERRSKRECEGFSFQSLNPADLVLYTSLHALRHLLRGNLRASHVYECAWFLHNTAADEQFWRSWHDMFSDDLRAYQAICFALAQRWFSCAFHPIAERAVRSLPVNINRWLAQYSHSSLAAPFKSNKDELWLHWSLLRSPRQRFQALRRRLIPGQLPGPVSAVHLKADQLTLIVRIQRQWAYSQFLWQRAQHHFASLLPTLIGAAVWIRDNWRDRWPYYGVQKF